MSPITDPAVRRRLTTLHAAFLAIAATIVDAVRDVDILREREATLRGRIAVLAAAADQLPLLIAEAKERVEQLRRDAERAEIELHHECYQALVAEFRARFAPLRADVLAPMLALAPSPRGGGSYLFEDSLIVIRTFEAGTTSEFNDDRLLGFAPLEREGVAKSARDEIVRLLATLSPGS